MSAVASRWESQAPAGRNFRAMSSSRFGADMHFAKLDDSPMFRKQILALEETAETLRDRCQKFQKGCRKYTEVLGEAYDGDIAFAHALEGFGGGFDDPISLAVGGPVMTKFTIALREIGTYKEVLRSEVEQTVEERLTQYVSQDLQDIKDLRKRFEKASVQYDQVRVKFMHLRKDAKVDVVADVEDDLRAARSHFEHTRFNLVSALSNLEAKKKFEFLEAVSECMDAHFRYFKQGYELLHQMEPYIHQVLTYAQQSRQRANYEQAALADRMQEYTRNVERENQKSFSNLDVALIGDGIQAVGKSSNRLIEAVMQTTPGAKVQTIKQGYLLKRSTNLRHDWKRRFFVLDSSGKLYYYRKQWGKPTDEKMIAHHTVDLKLSTIKMDAEQTDLRFCFRIISPMKCYTLQAENALDKMDWIDKITAVIASLLTSQIADERPPSSGGSSSVALDHDHSSAEDTASTLDGSSRHQSSDFGRIGCRQERPIDILSSIPGNGICADCGCPDPDWGSLNLGVLLCIDCAGIHRNLGVHVSKVRSLTLDTKAWEPSVMAYFVSIGNSVANSIWEEKVTRPQASGPTFERKPSVPSKLDFLSKPQSMDPLAVKERFIHMKYVDKGFVAAVSTSSGTRAAACKMWNAVHGNNKHLALRLIIDKSADANTTFEQATGLERSGSFRLPPVDGNGTMEEIYRGCTLLHVACQIGDPAMIELLLQHGARIDACDGFNRTPLHFCALHGKTLCAKILLARGACSTILDSRGRSPLDCLLRGGPPADDELVALLS